ncbi:MAG: AmmeMemoRadiSam system protein B [Kiritimatiellia bacterium]
MTKIVRRALGAGRWFPGDERQLSSMVGKCVESAEVEDMEGRIAGAIAPHAGYVYSGPVAGYTFRAIRDNAEKAGKPDVVVILGLSHRGGFGGTALMDGEAISTPMGEVKLDNEAAEALVSTGRSVEMNYAPHGGEHSAENQVPFVQYALPDTPVVIGLMGDHTPETVSDMVSGLSGLGEKRNVLVVASSDMLHDPDYEKVTNTDRRTLEKLAAMDAKGIRADWNYSEQILCGVAPVLTAMEYAAAEGCREGKVLYYRNSGDDFPESRGSWVVGYGAVVFSGKS